MPKSKRIYVELYICPKDKLQYACYLVSAPLCLYVNENLTIYQKSLT